MNQGQAYQRIEQLRTLLQDYAYQYYILDAPTVSDAIYDSLYRELEQLETQYPETIHPHSPTQRVGASIGPSPLQAIRRLRPMLSLGNLFSRQEVEAFDGRCKRLLQLPADTVLEYALEPKVDGLGVELIYEQGKLVQASTRGDGEVGEDVTGNVRTIANVPLQLRADGKPPKRLTVRGEVYLSHQAFAKLNQQRQAHNEPLFANPRNAAAGSLRQLDATITQQRQLAVVLYGSDAIPDPQHFATHTAWLTWLTQLGLKTLPVQLARGVAQIESLFQALQLQRSKLPYAIDGMVLKVNRHAYQLALGAVARAPRWAMAYKMPAEEGTSVIEALEVQVGRTGALTPVAHLRPVQLGGVQVERATLHNRDEIQRKDVRLGDTVVVRRAGDVIPEIVRVVPELRPSHSQPFVFPQECPACGHAVVEMVDMAVIRCPNRHCPGLLLAGLRHFVGRQAMDLEGFGEKLLQQLVEQGWVRQPLDLFALDAKALMSLPRMGDKRISNLLQQLAVAKQRPAHRLLFALGIRHVGSQTAKLLLQRFGSLPKLLQASQDDLEEVEGVGPEIAASIRQFAQDKQAMDQVEGLLALGLGCATDPPVDALQVAVANPLIFKDHQVVVTGSLQHLKREQAHQLIEAAGGVVRSGISKKITLLICGEDPGSKLSKAQALGIEIWDEQQFLQHIGYRPGKLLQES